MRIIFLGSPGVGKGTQAQLITQKHHIPQISTGDMLRKAIQTSTPLGFAAKTLMEQGKLVPDDIIIGLVKERISEPDCENGFLLDGFPRTIAQAEALRNIGVYIDYVIELRVSDDEIIKRLSGRRVHVPSGRVYHILYHPPKVDQVDDITGEPLVQRPDDSEETVRKRLEIYAEQTQPLVEYYKKWEAQKDNKAPQYRQVDGVGETRAVQERIEKVLKKEKAPND
jgi:adenylate kinase